MDFDSSDLVRFAVQGESKNFEDAFEALVNERLAAAIEGIHETVAPIKSEDEQRFADKHVVDKKDHPEAEESQFTSKAKKARRKADYDEGEEEEVYEEVELEEATFKPGNMKLKDGSSVKVSREDVKALADMFDELSGANKKKMEAKMMEDQEGFKEILQFAKEAF